MKRETLNGYFNLRREIQDYFGYKEDWEVLPLSDEREMYWMLVEDKTPFIVYSTEPLTTDTINDIGICIQFVYGHYKTRRTAYRRDDLVAVPLGPDIDGNKFLMIFDAAKEFPTSARAELRRQVELVMGY